MSTQSEKPLPADYKIDGLDMHKGIRNFSGREDIYFEVLRSFTVNVKPLLKAVQESGGDNPDDYIYAVHDIKGSSRSVCAESIGDMAESLEKAARAGDFDFVRSNKPALAEALEKLLTSIEDMLTEMETEKPRLEKPDRIILIKLLGACRDYDVDSMYAAMSELTRYEYEHDNALVQWLIEKADRFSLKEIAQRLSGMEL
jgi:HPt (histidine-containing phosphotransfer) domain-containing protein